MGQLYAPDGGRTRREKPTTDPFGEAIYKGTRDITVTSIAGTLHDGTRNLRKLAADLEAINQSRCKPPLDRDEVEKIARSIHKRPPCKKGTGDVGVAVRAALDHILFEVDVFYDWRGAAGNTDRSVLVALVKHAATYGTLIPTGVRVSISMRQLALAAGVSLPTAVKAI
jgi:Primase C terminal 1 (PriCT-1)